MPLHPEPYTPALEPVTVDARGKQARAFVAKTNEELKALWTRSARAQWAKATNITDENDAVAAKLAAEVMAYETQAIAKAAAFSDAQVDRDTARQLALLKLTSTLPAPDNRKKRERLANITARMESTYGKGKVCGADKQGCRDLGALSKVLATSRDYSEQLEAWTGWRTVSKRMKADYVKFVTLGNEGARALGFADMGELWRSRYDMSARAFEQEMERLWQQVRPLYEALHCHIRARLTTRTCLLVAMPSSLPSLSVIV